MRSVKRATALGEGSEKGHVRRLRWGCGDVRSQGWINSTNREGPHIDITWNILDGLPLDDESVDSISSQHVLQQLKVYDVLDALRELYRLLKPGGLLRLCLPDFDRAIDEYRNGRAIYFWCREWESLSGNFITQVMEYNFTRTPLTYEFTVELLQKAGFGDIRQTSYKTTTSAHPEIVELDSRPGDSFYVEAFKQEAKKATARCLPGTAEQIHLSWSEAPSTSLTVVWQTPSRNNRALVEYRVPGSETWERVTGQTRRSSGKGLLHQATMRGPRPGTPYEYRVSSDEGASEPVSKTFQTRTGPPPGPADFSFAFIFHCERCALGLEMKPQY